MELRYLRQKKKGYRPQMRGGSPVIGGPRGPEITTFTTKLQYRSEIFSPWMDIPTVNEWELPDAQEKETKDRKQKARLD